MTRVLVVDDHESITRLVSLILRTDGFEVDQASNGVEALDCIEAHEPDVVVMDMAMPVMDGPTLLARMRESGHDVPVLVISQFKASEIGSELHVEGVLPKPFDPDDLSTQVRRLANQR